MTNAQIIFVEAQRLAEEGIIKYTGRTFRGTNPAGEEVVIRETEPIHTFAAWKDLGYQVTKGSKAVTKLTIWKHSVKKDPETEVEKGRMFMKTAHFFSESQVTKIEK